MKSTALFQQLKAGVEALPEAERNDSIKKGINLQFPFVCLNYSKQEEAWTLDLKKGVVSQGKPEGKADIVINVSDDTFVDLAAGKINGQKAFMQGKLKIKGNMMLATKLDAVLKVAKKAPAPAAASAAPAAAPAPAAGGVEVAGFQSSKVFAEIAAGIADLEGLLLMYQAAGNANGLQQLAVMAVDKGKNNIAFMCHFLRGKVEHRMSRIVGLWRASLVKENKKKSAEPLADPYGNLFPDLEWALFAEEGFRRRSE
ncbi:hypothetical protein HK104_011220 [Borealophlyctis nickersoniae]|nr:hypothetical protein HK104_011220 [Borealophlyctis nickersoniae]